MVKTTENHEVAESGAHGHGLGDARAVVDRYVGEWFPIAWKVAVFYGVWISIAYYAMTTTVTPEASQIAAIGYWFGWLFLGGTLAVGIVIAVGGVVDRFRLAQHKRKY